MGSRRTFGEGDLPPDPSYANLYKRNAVFRRMVDGREMSAADLGIVDQNLDEKIGMDNPLDGTRLWDNS